MKIKEFLYILRESKFSNILTGFIIVKVERKRDMNFPSQKVPLFLISSGDHQEKVLIEFYKEHRMTIFEAEMIFSLFALNKKVMDYANYHKCQAGKEFIKNIKYVKAFVPQTSERMIMEYKDGGRNK
jgi:hypothetical protein